MVAPDVVQGRGDSGLPAVSSVLSAGVETDRVRNPPGNYRGGDVASTRPEHDKSTITMSVALIPVVFLIAALSVTIIVFDQPPHIPLILATAVATIVALFYKQSWRDIEKGMIHGITLALAPVLILMIVGTMIGTWIQGGVVPSMIYYGLMLLSPGIFLAATLLICTIVSIGTGSSWSTAGTVGVALIGVGHGLGIPAPLVAGAIISGAYFGDHMSPLSDATNLAPAVAGTDLFGHIRHTLYTAVPGYLIVLVIFGLIGTRFHAESIHSDGIELILSTIEANFFIHPIVLLPPVFVIAMVVRRVPPLPALLGGTMIGGIFALVAQGRGLGEVIQAAQSGFVAETGVPMVDSLLTRGGLEAMMSTVALIITALSFGGVMEKTGMLGVIAQALLQRVRSTGSLVATTVGSCIGMNAIGSDQYLAIVIPGRMYKNAYEARGLHPKNLSRALGNSGTLTSPLIPWNTCGAFMHVTLGVNPLAYLPYAFFNLITPAIAIFYGYAGITMHKAEPADAEALTEPAPGAVTPSVGHRAE
jgi:Na+:H+ antiporter, NhaC family